MGPLTGRSEEMEVEGGQAECSSSNTAVGEGKYQVISFRDIMVQGDYDNVMAFISDLDSGETLKTMVLKRVTIKPIEINVAGEEPRTETTVILNVDIYAKPEE